MADTHRNFTDYVDNHSSLREKVSLSVQQNHSSFTLHKKLSSHNSAENFLTISQKSVKLHSSQPNLLHFFTTHKLSGFNDRLCKECPVCILVGGCGHI